MQSNPPNKKKRLLSEQRAPWIWRGFWVLSGVGLLVTVLTPHDDSVETIATVCVAIGTLALALATVQLTNVSADELAAEKGRVANEMQRVQEDRERADKVQRGTQRPLLIPMAGFNLDQSLNDEAVQRWWMAPNVQLYFKNVGNGVASNVAVLILPVYEPEIDGGMLFYGKIPTPVTVTGSNSSSAPQRGAVRVEPGAHLGDVPLYAQHDKPSYARVTFSYWDVFNCKHASIFDWTYDAQWVQVAIRQEIDHDLYDLGLSAPAAEPSLGVY